MFNQPIKVMTYSEEIMTSMKNTASDMATIIGRYKGSMGVFAEVAREIMDLPNMDPYAKKKLEYLALAMEKCIERNEVLWENRGKRELEEAA